MVTVKKKWALYFIGLILISVGIINKKQINITKGNILKSKKNMNTESTKKPWCSLSQKELEAAKKNLTSESYIITQEDGTEQPFTNPYWNLKDDGIYIDIVSGEPLFSSTDKIVILSTKFLNSLTLPGQS